MDYTLLKTIHQGAVTLSVCGFFVRGVLALRGSALARSRAAKTLPHVVDTVLLASGLMLAWMLAPEWDNALWLVAKIVGLLLYIALGMVALRPGRPHAVRGLAWVGALATVAWIVSVAITKNPLGYFAPLA